MKKENRKIEIAGNNGLYIINWIYQKIFKINDCPWMVHFTSRVVNAGKIKLGKNVEQSFARSGGCYFQANNGIEFQDGVLFGPGVKIISANHLPGDLNRWEAKGKIKIGKRCWIGANAVILPGVSLGENVIVGAGAIVTKSFPANVIVAGNPAKIIRKNWNKR